MRKATPVAVRSGIWENGGMHSPAFGEKIRKHPWKWLGTLVLIGLAKVAEERVCKWANERIDEHSRPMIIRVRDICQAAIDHPWHSAAILVGIYAALVVLWAYASVAVRGYNQTNMDPIKPKPDSDAARTSPETPPVTVNAPGGTVSVNQRGGITAGKVIIKTDLPEPELSAHIATDNQLDGGLYKTIIFIDIKTKVTVPNVYLSIAAPSIVSMIVSPLRSGLSMSGHSGVRDGWVFTNLINAYGTYRATVTTKSAETLFTIECRPEYN